MLTPLFFALPTDEMFAERVARAVGGELGRLSTHAFPDGETYIRLITSPASRDVIIVAGLNHPNEKILPILLLADAARQMGAVRVGLVAPYLPYMRQDKSFRPGEAVTSRSFAGLISRAVDWLITVDPHLHRIQQLADVYSIPAYTTHATNALGQWVARNVASPILVGPDDESRQWVGAVAANAHAPFVILTKTRRGDADVSVSIPELGGYPDCTPVLLDDIISTGQTMAAAVRHITETHHLMPICIGVHAVFANGAYKLLEDAGAALVLTTNTIPHHSNGIDIVPMLASAVRERIGYSAAPYGVGTKISVCA